MTIKKQILPSNYQFIETVITTESDDLIDPKFQKVIEECMAEEMRRHMDNAFKEAFEKAVSAPNRINKS